MTIRELSERQKAARRETMSPAQRARLEALAIATSRYAERNKRMDRGLRMGFRALEREDHLTPSSEMPAARKVQP